MPKNENAVSYDTAPNILTVKDLMQRWSVSRKQVLEAINAKRLAAFRVGKNKYRVTLAEVQRFENARAA